MGGKGGTTTTLLSIQKRTEVAHVYIQQKKHSTYDAIVVVVVAFHRFCGVFRCVRIFPLSFRLFGFYVVFYFFFFDVRFNFVGLLVVDFLRL